MSKLGALQKTEVVVVGDTPYDAEAAGMVGLSSIGSLCGGFAESELREVGCFAIYDGAADLLARYDESALPRTLTATERSSLRLEVP